MLDWLKNIKKEYPEFWKAYLGKFENKSNRYVIFSTETTGTNLKDDVILSIGAIGVIDDKIKVSDNFETVIFQYKFLHDHGLSNDSIINSKLTKMTEDQAIQSFIEYIGNATLVGHQIQFDILMINEVLEKMGCGKIKNEALDIEIMHQKLHDLANKPIRWEDLSKHYKINVSENNTVLDEAYSMALVFLKLKTRLGIK